MQSCFILLEKDLTCLFFELDSFFIVKNYLCALFGCTNNFSNQKEWKKEMLQPALPLSDFSFALPLAFGSCMVLVPSLV